MTENTFEKNVFNDLLHLSLVHVPSTNNGGGRIDEPYCSQPPDGDHFLWLHFRSGHAVHLC